MTGILTGNGDQCGCGLSFFFLFLTCKRYHSEKTRQVRVTIILMMMSHAVNIATVISFLIEFNTSGMTSFFNFFACIPNKRYHDSLKHGNFVLNTISETKIRDLHPKARRPAYPSFLYEGPPPRIILTP